MKITFTVTAEVERLEGRFARKDELADQIEEAIENADPGDVEGENGGVYEVVSWEVGASVTTFNITVAGKQMPLVQAIELTHLINKADEGTTHWHFNDCGCCISLHGPDYSYVIGADGESDFYPERGCSCE